VERKDPYYHREIIIDTDDIGYIVIDKDTETAGEELSIHLKYNDRITVTSDNPGFNALKMFAKRGVYLTFARESDERWAALMYAKDYPLEDHKLEIGQRVVVVGKDYSLSEMLQYLEVKTVKEVERAGTQAFIRVQFTDNSYALRRDILGFAPPIDS